MLLKSLAKKTAFLSSSNFKLPHNYLNNMWITKNYKFLV
jgi:hypothetical protein